MNRTELERRARLWQRHRTIRRVWLAAAAGFITAALFVRWSPVVAITVGLGVLALTFVLLGRRAPVVTATTVAAHLNRLCPPLEESAGLWLRDSSTLELLEQLQLRRLDAAWSALADRATVGLPSARALQSAIGLWALATLILLGASFWPQPTTPASAPTPIAVSSPHRVQPLVSPTLRNAALEIAPPAYLGQAIRRIDGLDADVAEGSVVTWDLAFDGHVSGVSLVMADGKENVVAEALGSGRFRARSTIAETRVYQLRLEQDDGERALWPELHVVKAIRDQAPRLTWQEPMISRSLVDPAAGRPSVNVRLTVVDDHGIDAVTLVMTVAKGSGEGVKFREQELSLERMANSDEFGRVLDLTALGLEPGDELYFHARATDRRSPTPNRARSETRFVVLRGPATELAAPPVGLAGVNRLPQYFRSQRQLIIDTERLLADRASLPVQTFRERSEDIGVDQKLLRLRYGQFLGEEFEPVSSGAPKEAQGMAMAGALRGQSRESLSRAAAVERAVEAQHAHPTASERDGRPLTVEEIIAPFAHVHDNAEAATLFDTHVKTALRAVLAAMWEAEGFLRTARPAEALPAENRALELLKALQQADRVFVQRVGYEAAPIKIDERRLRGELDAIPKRAQSDAQPKETNAAAEALKSAVASLTATSTSPVPSETSAAVGARLVLAAQEQPDQFLTALEWWRRPPAALTGFERAALRQKLWSLLPPASELPQRPEEPAPKLALDYFTALLGKPEFAR